MQNRSIAAVGTQVGSSDAITAVSARAEVSKMGTVMPSSARRQSALTSTASSGNAPSRQAAHAGSASW